MKTSGLVFILAALPMVFAACSEPKGASGTAASSSAALPAGHPDMDAKVLKAGDSAPAVTLTLQDGRKVELSSLQGKQVLVYFYPKDETPGCTFEAEGLRDGWSDIQAAGLEVFGVSTQDAESHKGFIENHKLPFPLVVDTDGAVAQAFHVPMKNGFAARQSFLIGKDGKIKYVWLNVDPKQHAATVLAAAKG